MDSNRKRLIILKHPRRSFASVREFVVRMGRVLAVTVTTAYAVFAAAFAWMPVPAHAHGADEVALGSLVDAELAFARMGLERGVRAAFLAHFADDGVVFEPAPVRLREAWNARPPPADPLAFRLEWKPAQAGVSRSHDMGYTTGPFTASNAARPGPVRHGVFFSVWQRDGSGRWQVLLDAGIGTPGIVDFAPLGAAPRPRFHGSARRTTERNALLAREAAGPQDAGLTPNAYAQLLATDVRLHRDDMSPLASRGTAAAEIARRMSRVVWKPIDARVSAAADMAVTYGRYRETGRDGNTRDGYYAHLWLRDATGAWRIGYDVALPTTP
jgi:ketosteroid isomerase-like protein